MKRINKIKQEFVAFVEDNYGVGDVRYVSACNDGKFKCGFSINIDRLVSVGSEKLGVKIIVKYAKIDRSNDKRSNLFNGGMRTFNHACDDVPDALMVMLLWNHSWGFADTVGAAQRMPTLLPPMKKHKPTLIASKIKGVQPIKSKPGSGVFFRYDQVKDTKDQDTDTGYQNTGVQDSESSVNILMKPCGVAVPSIILFGTDDHGDILSCIKDIFGQVEAVMMLMALST